MVDGAVAHTPLPRVAVEGIGEVIPTHRPLVPHAVVGADLVILQGETVISTVRGSTRGVRPGGTRHPIEAGVVVEEGDDHRRIRDPEARRDGELHGTTDILRKYCISLIV